jgi:hypothetical protein
MQVFKFVRNGVAICTALLAIITSAAKAAAQTQPTTAVKTVLLIHGAWVDGSSWSKLIPLLEAKGLCARPFRQRDCDSDRNAGANKRLRQ